MDTSWTGNCKGGPAGAVPLVILDDGTAIDAQIHGTALPDTVLGVAWYIHGPADSTVSGVIDNEDYASSVTYRADQAAGSYLASAHAFFKDGAGKVQIKIALSVGGRGAANSSPVTHGNVCVATAILPAP